MRAARLATTVFALSLAAGCSGSSRAPRTFPDAGRTTQASVAGASADAGRSRDASALDAAARDAGLLDGAARDAGHVDSGITVAKDAGAVTPDQRDSSMPNVPPALQAFADDVRRASEQGQSDTGPVNCAAPLPSVQVMSATDAASAVREYVAAVLGVPVSELHEEVQACGGAGQATCASAFNLFTGSFGGRVSETVYPLAQQLDSGSTSERLTTFTVGQSGGLEVVVLSAAEAGWSTGIAFFGGRANCAPSD